MDILLKNVQSAHEEHESTREKLVVAQMDLMRETRRADNAERERDEARHALKIAHERMKELETSSTLLKSKLASLPTLWDQYCARIMQAGAAFHAEVLDQAPAMHRSPDTPSTSSGRQSDSDIPVTYSSSSDSLVDELEDEAETKPMLPVHVAPRSHGVSRSLLQGAATVVPVRKRKAMFSDSEDESQVGRHYISSAPAAVPPKARRIRSRSPASLSDDEEATPGPSVASATPCGQRSRVYPCSLCPQVLASSSNRSRHIKRIHEKLKPHKCAVCDYASSQAIDLTRHMKTKHATPESSELSSNNPLPESDLSSSEESPVSY